MVCSLLLLNSGSAEGPGDRDRDRDNDRYRDKELGTVLQVPLASLGPIMAQNIARQNNVSLLHVSQEAVGYLNSQVATISVRQYNKDGKKHERARTVWLPVADLGWIQQTNRDTVFIQQGVYGVGNLQTAQVQVYQGNASAPGPVATGTRFLLCPLSGLGSLLAQNQRNLSLVRINQFSAGDYNSQVALLSVSQENSNKVKVPKSLVNPLVQLNLNLVVVTQVAVGTGNSQVAVVDVGQDNNLTSPDS
jgi:hypothetical protein